MFANERYKIIMDMLKKGNSVKVSSLTKKFNVSIETVRRDLEFLEKNGSLKRVHGGAVLKEFRADKINFKERVIEGAEGKKEIANTALKYIKEGQTIALCAGTTTLEVAKAIKKNFKKMTVITNSRLIADELSDMDNYTVIVTGGILDKSKEAMVGEIACETLKRFRVDISFVGASGVSLIEGVTNFFIDQLSVQKTMIKISLQNIILADSSKFNSVCLLKLCDFDEVNVIISDSKLKKEVKDEFLDNGIEIDIGKEI